MHPKFGDKFTSFYANWTYVTGNTYWRIWSLFPSNQWLQNIWILAALFNCDFINIFPGIFFKTSFHYLSLPSLPHKITYIQTVLRQKRSQIWLFCCRFIFPKPQLTPDCDRIILFGVLPSDGLDFNLEYVVTLFQMFLEIRISEDYCRSDIIVSDYGNFTLRHIWKINPSLVENCELCAFVSLETIFWIYIVPK